MFANFSSHCKQIDASYLFIKTSNLNSRVNSYELNVKKLDPERCHMFFPLISLEEILIITSLEYIIFTPGHPLNKEFKAEIITCGEIRLSWCSFPKRYRGECERAGKVFGMTMRNISRTAVLPTETILKIPPHQNILIFQGERLIDPSKTEISKFMRDCDDIEWIGKSLERLGVD